MATTPSGPNPEFPTRLFALGVLSALATFVLYAGREVYAAATDAFVAPIILSPDNDAVIASKLSLAQLEVERAKTAAQIDACAADLAAGEQAITRLHVLAETVSTSLVWTDSVDRRLASKGTVELKALEHQAAILGTMVAAQQTLTDTARDNLKAGLISQTDYVKETLALSQLNVARLENERSRVEGRAQIEEVRQARDALAHERHTPALPEQLLREDQTVRIELELLKLESEQRARRAEEKLAGARLATIDELEAQLRARPIFRASQESLDIAFVPYTQIEGVSRGAEVYSCIWGIFHCRLAGTVAEVVKGEVILPDPWGNQARGFYAVLHLQDHAAARAKTLRIREVR